MGIRSIPVLKGARGLTELQDVVQLKVDTISESPFDFESYEFPEFPDSLMKYEICNKCGHKRYRWLEKGKFPEFQGYTADALTFKTQEYFGTGSLSYREIIIKPELYRVLYDNNLIEKLHFSVLGDPK